MHLHWRQFLLTNERNNQNYMKNSIVGDYFSKLRKKTIRWRTSMTFRTFRHDFFAMDNSALFIKTFDNNELLWKIQRLFHSIVRVWRKYQTKTNNIHSLLMMITQKCLWLNSWSLDELPISNKKNNWNARTQTSSLENCSVSKLTKTPTNQASGTQNILVWVSFSLNN